MASNTGSKGNLMRILGLILKELMEINAGIKRMNGQAVDTHIYFEKDSRYNNDSNRLGK